MEPTDRLTVTLTAQEWNSLMTLLGEAPFRVVALLIQQIQSQCMAQQGGPGAAPNGHLVPGPAGPFPRVVAPEQPAG